MKKKIEQKLANTRAKIELIKIVPYYYLQDEWILLKEFEEILQELLEDIEDFEIPEDEIYEASRINFYPNVHFQMGAKWYQKQLKTRL